MSDVQVSSWLELQDALFDNTWQPGLLRHRSNVVFRGVPRVTHALESSLQTYRKTNGLLPGPLQKVLEENDVNIFTTEMLSSVATSLARFDALSRRDFVLFFEPPSLDERIVNQFALFSLPSSAEMSLENLLSQREAMHRRVIIPAALKWEVRDKLDQANITERVLFPGLDGLSQWLKRYFTTRQ
ncbi:MAG TPA: hypothetical protein VMS98_20340 [Thermoanaerobaculia bacterium]|nr:hypothetical protein [Thermoanaerobaculia bacterium]